MTLFHPLESPIVSAASGAFAVLAALGIAIVATSLRTQFITRREANKARHQLGPPKAKLDEPTHGNAVTLQGILVMSGKPCPRFEDGKDAAVATARGRFSAVTARAERLTLTLADTSIEIIGEVEVLVGSTEAQPGPLEFLSNAPAQRIKDARSASRDAPSGPVCLRTLVMGDRVIARGKLVRAGTDSSATGYREDGAPWILVGDDNTPVQLAFEGRPRVSGAIKAAVARQRTTRGWGLAVTTCVAIGGALGVAAGAKNAHELAETVAAMETSKPAAIVSDPKRCNETETAYKSTLKTLQSCTEDNDCTVELRGEQWFDLDGCFRLRNQHISTVKADIIAKRWLEQRCLTRYEICTMNPRPMCRNGQCVERPPAPLPETWVRHFFSKQLTFFTPPEIVERLPESRCGLTDFLALLSENLRITLELYIPNSDQSYLSEWTQVSFGGGTFARLKELPVSETVERGFIDGFVVVASTETQEKRPWEIMVAGLTGALNIHVQCKTKQACKDARLMLGTIDSM